MQPHPPIDGAYPQRLRESLKLEITPPNVPLSPDERREALADMHWNTGTLAVVLNRPYNTVRAWMNGKSNAPHQVDAWLARRARGMRDDPPPNPKDR